jgi:hypothetical protein
MSLGMLGKFSAQTPGIILIALMDDLSKFLNVTNTLNADQMAQTADLILRDYRCRNLKPEDYKVIFTGIKKGEYGRAFNRMDGQELFVAIYAYIERRDAWIEENSYREHNHRKENEKTNIIAPEVVEMYKEILKAVKVEEDVKVAEVPLAPKPPREKSPRDILIQKLFAEFTQKTSSQEGKPFLELNGEMLDQAEWVEKMLARTLEENKD